MTDSTRTASAETSVGGNTLRVNVHQSEHGELDAKLRAIVLANPDEFIRDTVALLFEADDLVPFVPESKWVTLDRAAASNLRRLIGDAILRVGVLRAVMLPELARRADGATAPARAAHAPTAAGRHAADVLGDVLSTVETVADSLIDSQDYAGRAVVLCRVLEDVRAVRDVLTMKECGEGSR